jgi:Haemolysin-III related
MTDSASVGSLALRVQPEVIVHRCLWSRDPYRSGADEDLIRSVVLKGPQYDARSFAYMTMRFTYGEKRADERTRTAYPCSLRVRKRQSRRVHRSPQTPINKRFSHISDGPNLSWTRVHWHTTGTQRVGVSANTSWPQPYLGMGWVAVIAAPALFLAVPAGGMIWVLGGGLLYTAGALIYALKRPNPAPGTFGFHELWHLFVVAGSACHYWAVLCYLVPLA